MLAGPGRVGQAIRARIFVTQRIDHAAPGPLHQLGPGDRTAVDRALFQGAHLITGQYC